MGVLIREDVSVTALNRKLSRSCFILHLRSADYNGNIPAEADLRLEALDSNDFDCDGGDELHQAGFGDEIAREINEQKVVRQNLLEDENVPVRQSGKELLLNRQHGVLIAHYWTIQQLYRQLQRFTRLASINPLMAPPCSSP